MSPPRLFSMLSQPVVVNNFLAVQSCLLSPGTTSISVTFTNIPSTQRVTYKLTNTGNNNAWICGSRSTATVAAVVSTSLPQPTSTLLSTSICDCVPSGAVMVLDFIGGTDTISAICAATTSTTLEISIGAGA